MSARIETKELKEIKCPHMGTVNVFVQGQRSGKETVILNVHDLGYNHSHYVEFLNDMSIKKIAQKSVWVFVVLPGHLGESSDLPDDYVFPSLQAIADDLVTVLEELKIKDVVLFGDGAGANILLRFALSNPSRVLGAFFINVTAASNTLLETVQDKFRTWQITDSDKASADEVLVFHRFGAKPSAIMKYHHSNATRMAVERYQEFVHRHLNIHNVKLYIEAYNKRTAISDISKLRCSAVFVTSERSSFRRSTRNIHQALLKVNSNKNKVEFVDVSNAGHVMEESPEKVTESLQYFLQGLGVVSSVPMQNLNVVKQPRVRSMSMQDYDIPVKVRQRQRNISVAEYGGEAGRPVVGETRARRSAAGSLVIPGEANSSPQSPQKVGGNEEPIVTPHKVAGINSIPHSEAIAEEEEKPAKKEINGTAEN